MLTIVMKSNMAQRRNKIQCMLAFEIFSLSFSLLDVCAEGRIRIQGMSQGFCTGPKQVRSSDHLMSNIFRSNK